MTKHSKQRDAVYTELACRKDHPTAEELYVSLKQKDPSIGIATVYRNLSILENEGKILRISSQPADRFDADISDHYHLVCDKCGCVSDLWIKDIALPKDISGFNGVILSQSVMFHGYCEKCASTIS